jgi:hypothetical protein
MTRSLRPLLFLALLLLHACASPRPKPVSNSLTLTTEGQAVIVDNSKLLARRKALQDAIRHATMEAGTAIKSFTQVNNGSVLFDTFSMRSAAAISSAHIIKEWEDKNTYHVRAKISLSANDFCKPQYRKRIVATGFNLAQPEHLSSTESTDIVSGIPREIMHLLEDSQDFIGTNQTHIAIYAQPADQAPNQNNNEPYLVSKIMQTASENGAQFVLSGVIRDLKVELAQDIQGNNIFSLAKSLARSLQAKRSIGIDIYVHDGFTGALLTQFRYTDDITGDVWIPANYTVGSKGFRDTKIGAKISHIIDTVSKDVGKALSCYPFTTRILQINNNSLIIDAGAQENVHLGDQLVVYADTNEELHLNGFQEYIGRDKRAVGVITIHDVKARYAIGELDVAPKDAGLQEGDWVRAF